MKQFEIKLTFYNPKELWQKFCNLVFWPRRKECVQWCDFYEGVLDSKIVEILMDEYNKGNITEETEERLEIALEQANCEVSKLTAKLMSKPF